MKKIQKLLGVLALSLFMFSSTQAVVITGWRATSVLTWGPDSTDYPPDSVLAYFAATSFGGDVDSMVRITTSLCKLQGWPSSTPDSLCRTCILPYSTLGDVATNPAIVFYWYYNGSASDPLIVRDNTPMISAMILRADSLGEEIVLSGSGTGGTQDTIMVLNSLDSSVIGAGISVWAYPNDGGGVLQATTDANGFAVFSMVVDTYLVYMWNAGFFQTDVPDSNFVIDHIRDSAFMTQTTSTSPATPNLTAVDFYFYDAKGIAINNVPVVYSLYVPRGAEVHHLDSTKSLALGRVGSVRSNTSGKATIQVIPNDSIVVAPNELGTTRYRIEATNPKTGLPLFGDRGILLLIPASAAGLTYPSSF